MGLGALKKQVTKRPLNIFYLLDTSGSMYGEKIEALNSAMHDLEHAIKREAKKNPGTEVSIRIATFGGPDARWQSKVKIPVNSFVYEDINDPDGPTPMGCAFRILCDALDSNHMPDRSFKPIVVLLSDGAPTDNWEKYLNNLLSLPWGKKAVKVAIAFGNDADKDMLAKFTTDPDCVYEANDATNLVRLIQWTSTLITNVSQSRGDEKIGTGGRKYLHQNPVKIKSVINDHNDL